MGLSGSASFWVVTKELTVGQNWPSVLWLWMLNGSFSGDFLYLCLDSWLHNGILFSNSWSGCHSDKWQASPPPVFINFLLELSNLYRPIFFQQNLWKHNINSFNIAPVKLSLSTYNYKGRIPSLYTRFPGLRGFIYQQVLFVFWYTYRFFLLK